jgi:hypothetical protein
LEACESQAGHGIRLLQIVQNATVDGNVRLAGATSFKNLVRKNWEVKRPLSHATTDLICQRYMRHRRGLLLYARVVGIGDDNSQRELIVYVGRRHFGGGSHRHQTAYCQSHERSAANIAEAGKNAWYCLLGMLSQRP